ncbi:MAG TPA: hypothetical protein VGQ81_06415 [Acidobacteriota bacterium]|nr:hypothetical protein [Acidobacteriota bacterium]
MAASAIDVISPAFERTKLQLFRPFRFKHWARLAIIGLVTGEFGGASGSWGGLSNARTAIRTRRQWMDLLSAPDPSLWNLDRNYLWALLAVVAALLVLGLMWLYAASVFRFILLDAIVNGRCRLREGWHRWQAPGRRFFFWTIGFILVVAAAFGVTVGVPIAIAVWAGVFQQPRQHLILLIFGGIVLFFLVLAMIVASAVIALFARDFLVPLMALENLEVMAAWRRLLPLVNVEKASYLFYVLMKIVLAVGSAILFGILNVIVILLLLIPLAIVGGLLFLFGQAAGLTWNLFTICALVFLGLAAFAALLWVISFVYAPGLVFFQSYALYFLGPRYPLLGALLAPQPP